jgi:hypothetical protein
MTSFLLDERPLVFLPGLGRAFGITPALLLQQFHYYLRLPGGIDDSDGMHWTWQKIEDLRKCLGDAIDESTIRRSLDKLEGTGVLLSTRMADLDPSWDRRDRTKAYRIDYEVFSRICGQPVQASASKMQNARLQASRPGISKCAKDPKHISTQSTRHKSHAAASRARDPAISAAAEKNTKPHGRERSSGITCYDDNDHQSAERIESTYTAEEIHAAVATAKKKLNNRGNPLKPTPGVVETEVLLARSAFEQAARSKARQDESAAAEIRRWKAGLAQRDADPISRKADDNAAQEATAAMRKLFPKLRQPNS